MNLPPYLSRTPPPLNGAYDDDNADEEFGAFVVGRDLVEHINCAPESSKIVAMLTNETEGCSAKKAAKDELSDEFEKEAHTLRYEDTISEDSGYWMNSAGQIQSPCDTSPLSSSYNNRGNDSVNDVHSTTYFNSAVGVENSTDLVVGSAVLNAASYTNSSHPENEEQISVDESSVRKASTEQMPSFTNGSLFASFEREENETATNAAYQLDSYGESLYFEHDDIEENVFPTLNEQVLKPGNDNNTLHEVEKETVSTILKDSMPDDEFSDFTGFESTSTCFETSETNNKLTKIDSEYMYEEILGNDEIDINFTCNFYALQSVIKSNIVWNCLQSFEETPAFKYQWSSSCTSMKLLQALQIDSRNILHSPWSKATKVCWSDLPSACVSISFNSDFARCSVKAVSQVDQLESIPDAHFDWVSSGLVNPLQTISHQQFINESQIKNSADSSNGKTNELLQSLPVLSFVKAHHIVFKRD